MKIPHKVLGVAFLCLLLLGVWCVDAVFTKKFVSYDRVTLQTSRIGLQLPERADVKIRGVIVGEVLDFKPTDTGAEITLGLYPDEVDTIPSDVTGAIVPKTLFGEKYVALEVPASPSTKHIETGDVIRRTDVSIEVETVLSDIYPLLTTVQPADLNTTLNAIATALEGRGEQLGQNITVLDSYLKRMNPQIPKLIADLRLTTKVSNVYADVLPQIAQILRNTVVTGKTVTSREEKIAQLFTDVSSFSDTATAFLNTNGDNLIRLGEVGEPMTRLLAKYSPEYPCLMQGIVTAGQRQGDAFRGFTLHINLETLPNQPRGYTPADKPRYGDTDGPHCGELPNPSYTQDNPFTKVPNFDDGVDSPTGKGTSRVATSYGKAAAPSTARTPLVGSAQESALLRALIGRALAMPADQVDGAGALLLAPLARGSEVSFQ